MKRETKPLIIDGPVIPEKHFGANSLVIVPSCTSCSYKSFDLAKDLRLSQGKVVIVDDGPGQHSFRKDCAWAKRGENRAWSILSEGAVYDWTLRGG
jgi:hypothetical protein